MSPGRAAKGHAEKALKERAAKANRLLAKVYPDASCSLKHVNAFQLLVATILSAQCTDERVNIVTRTLFRRYRTVRAFSRSDREDLEEAVRSTGFYRNKAAHIRKTAGILLSRHGGKVPDDMDSLLALPGVARKTANVILGTWFGISEGIVVDTHVLRISGRLGLTASADPARVERDLMGLFPRKDWIALSHRMIRLGREWCRARKPECPGCPLMKICPFVSR